MPREDGPLETDEHRVRGNRRRRRDRWEARFRPILYGSVIDAIIFVVLLVAQRRTRVGLDVLSRRLGGDQEAKFPRARLLGNGNIGDFERVASELEDVRRTATTDSVTGLASPATVRTNLLLYTEVAAREGAWIGACVADLDHFKQINDTFGHAAGDEALRLLGERFKGVLTSGQPVGRWGGDEFLLLLPRMDLAATQSLADELRRHVDREPFQISDEASVRLTVTVGVAAGCGEELEAMRLFNAADGDLLEAKKDGRNKVGRGRLLGSPRLPAAE